MVDLYQLVAHADRLLEPGAIRDYCPNGLQVEGKRSVVKIVTGVSACMPLFEAAKEAGAEAVLVHHGMFFKSDPRVVKGSLKKRLSFLLENDLSLIGYHLPLDRHPRLGNNARLASILGLTEVTGFGVYNGKPIGVMGRLLMPVSMEVFMEWVEAAINPAARSYRFGKKEVETVALVSGGAPELVREAVEAGVDLFLTGEDAEWVYHLSREEGIHYVAAGHHATERFGVRALGEELARAFDIAHLFIDIPNPI
jgi:dinuclear metal center YbgI/SA1388 family protein